MSCRSTAGGRAASACATVIVPGTSGRIPALLHTLRRRGANGLAMSTDVSVEEVEEVLLGLARLARITPGINESRKARALERVEQAVEAYRRSAEPLPDRETLQAWAELPAALEAETRAGEASAQQPMAQADPEFRRGVDAVNPYHKAFSRIDPDVARYTDALFRRRPSRLSKDEAKQVFEDWIGNVSRSYGVPAPTLMWDDNAVFVGGGEYRPRGQQIRMSKVSITTLIHEYRHHMQHLGAPMIHPDLEEDARAWSLSLYYSVRPNLLRRLVTEGQIFHISAADFD
jgi:hypothetical protein